MKTTKIIIGLLIGILFVSCGSLEMNSKWRDREIKIDGYQADWRGVLTYLENKKISVGLLNDDNYLYACLVTGDRRTQSQISRMGFTIWFDVNGGKDKKYGIRFPIGMKDIDPVMMREMMGNQEGGRLRELPQARLNEIEIVGPGDDDRRRELISDLEGLEIKLETSLDLLVYEIKVPLSQTDRNTFSIDVNPGDVLGIGLETVKMDMEGLREQKAETVGGGGGGMRGGDGRRGGGGGGRGGGPGGGGRGGMQMPEQFKIWAKVQLANQ
jgi:hypothetical protein